MNPSPRTRSCRTPIGWLVAAALCVANVGCAGGAAQTRPSTPYKGDAVWNISSTTSAPTTTVSTGG